MGAQDRTLASTQPIGPTNHGLRDDVINRFTTAVQTMAPRGLST